MDNGERGDARISIRALAFDYGQIKAKFSERSGSESRKCALRRALGAWARERWGRVGAIKRELSGSRTTIIENQSLPSACLT